MSAISSRAASLAIALAAPLRAFICAYQRIFSMAFSAAIRLAFCFLRATFVSALAIVLASIAFSFLNSCTTIGIKFDVNAQSSSVDCVNVNGLIKPFPSN